MSYPEVNPKFEKLEAASKAVIIEEIIRFIKSKESKKVEIALNIFWTAPLQLDTFSRINRGSCNITKNILYWQHDQTITDRICRSSLSPHLQRKCQAGDLP